MGSLTLVWLQRGVIVGRVRPATAQAPSNRDITLEEVISHANGVVAAIAVTSCGRSFHCPLPKVRPRTDPYKRKTWRLLTLNCFVRMPRQTIPLPLVTV